MNNGSLFDNVGLLPSLGDTVPVSLQDFGNDNGVYLETVELQNWGPFSGVTEIPLQGHPALLVGENGTGKSSLMDAILTLLISRDLHYNSASDNKSNRTDERTLMEYVLGVAGSRLEEEGEGVRKETRYLRQTGEISIILLRFRTGTEFLTVANVFFAEVGKKDPQRFYVYAKRPLSILSDFRTNATGFEGFRSVIGQKNGVTATTDRNRYFSFVRNEIGLSDDNAMKLLKNLSSMKSLPKPDEFIREHMLPSRMNYRLEFEKMKQAMEEIHEIGRRLSDTRKRFMMLDALAPYIRKAKSLQEDSSLWGALRDKAIPFVYQYGKPVAEKEIHALEEKKASLRKRAETLEKKKESCIERKAVLEAKQLSSGGNMIAQKQAELSSLLDEKHKKEVLCEKLSALLSAVGIESFPDTAFTFQDFMDKISAKKDQMEAMYRERFLENDEAKRELTKATDNYNVLERQKMLLEKNKQVINSRLIAVRDEVCDSLQIPREKMPFLGEFLSVKEGDEEWRPALEHLLYTKSVAFLVPEEFSDAVTAFFDIHERSGQRVRRLVMHPITVRNQFRKEKGIPLAYEKIAVRQGTPFTAWIEAFLKDTAGNYCCESIKDFNSCYPAILKTGQRRDGYIAHEKDERFDIFDPKNFVMNGSFEEKKKALIQAVEEADGAVSSARKNFLAAVNRLKSLQQEQELLGNIPFIVSFDEIDVASTENKIEACREMIASLENNQTLEKIAAAIKAIVSEIETVSSDMRSLQEEIDSVTGKLGSLISRTNTYQEQLDTVVFEEKEKEVLTELYTKHGPDSLNPKFDSIMGAASKMVGQIARRSSELSVECDRECREAESRMRAYLEEFKSRRADLEPSMTKAGEADKFLAELQAVSDDNLPKAIEAYNEVKNFGKLDALRHFVSITTSGVDQEIRKAVEDVNKVLRKVPYSQGTHPTFLQVNCLQNRDGDIVKLRQMLSMLAKAKGLAVLSQTTAEEADDIMRTADELVNFLEPRVGRIRKDRYYEDNILDPRNWFVFPVSVCREEVMGNGEVEIVHVKELDKANKQSSGEGEKFTYFILAACFAIWMHLLDPDYGGRTFRFLMIDEIGNKLSPSNLHDVIALFHLLRIQLVSILPQGDKVSEYENFVGNIIQTDWLDKIAGVSFVDTVSLTEYARRNKDRVAEQVKAGIAARERFAGIAAGIADKEIRDG